MRLAWTALVVGIWLSVAGSGLALDRDGLSIESAIVIQAANTQDGIAQEYAHIRRVYPGWRRTRQALLSRNGRRYDMLTIASPSGETRDIYFDIDAFFGKM